MDRGFVLEWLQDDLERSYGQTFIALHISTIGFLQHRYEECENQSPK